MPKSRGLLPRGLPLAVRWLSALLLAGSLLAGPFLAGCTSHSPRPEIVPQDFPGALQTLPLAAGSYRVDSALSEIRLLVFRAGPLARLGHNHVIINRQVSGSAHVASDDIGTASFSLTIPVAGFVVDEVQARSEEGSDYAADVSDDARAGTLHNMLSAELLDASQFPVITLDGDKTSGDRRALTSTVSVSVAGHRSSVVIPFTVVNAEGRLRATGSVTLRQSALGLTPFRAMLGALTVQDEFIVKFSVVAVAI